MSDPVPVYEAVGGLPFRFYDKVASDQVLLSVYPQLEDLAPARRRPALFLSEYWGGPPAYSAERGHLDRGSSSVRGCQAPLGRGCDRRNRGVMRLVYKTPTWDDLVELAFDEIRAFGTGQYRVARRLRALLHGLIADLPEHRRPALVAQSVPLSDAVEHSFRQTQRADALGPDRQGIGMSQKERNA